MGRRVPAGAVLSGVCVGAWAGGAVRTGSADEGAGEVVRERRVLPPYRSFVGVSLVAWERLVGRENRPQHWLFAGAADFDAQRPESPRWQLDSVVHVGRCGVWRGGVR